MTFQEVKETINSFLHQHNVSRYEIFENHFKTSEAESVIRKQLQTVECQLANDIVITTKDFNVDTTGRLLLEYIDVLQFISVSKQTTNEFKTYCLAVQELLTNWAKLFDLNEKDLAVYVEKLNQKLQVLGQIAMQHFSMFELIELAKMQADNLRKWNSFKPISFELASHYLDMLLERNEKGDAADATSR